MASQRPSASWRRSGSEPCDRLSPAQASSPDSFPPPLRAHTHTGCGPGGTRKRNISRSVETRLVNTAAIADVEDRHVLAEPVPVVGTGWGKG
jgi:hypothetical protein